MTPGARVAAAIEILDAWLSGAPAEKALTNWARASRFAGSKDRAAVRDLVFDALRCKVSFSLAGGAETGRGLMLGAFWSDPALRDGLFSGQGHAPPPMTPAERAHSETVAEIQPRVDFPAWLLGELEKSLGPDLDAVAQLFQSRAPVFLRVNTRKASTDHAIARLRETGIVAEKHALAPMALMVTEGARKLRQSAAYSEGLVELQDAASQAVVDALGDLTGLSCLDYCAGGGGKALAMAAQGANVTVHDIDAARMRDIPDRAARAGVEITRSDAPQKSGPYDLVLCDAPCSGSGAWRRSPEGKWALGPGRLKELTAVQAEILDDVTRCVAPGGRLAYVTCSLLQSENEAQSQAFMERNSGWSQEISTRLSPLEGGDGFYLAIFRKT